MAHYADMSFWDALHHEKPLQVVGVINAYVAIMAKQLGYKALYLSGAGIANSSFGVPDTGITTLDNVLEDVRRITKACDLPLLVDIDTGFGNIKKTIQEMNLAGASAIHIEDQVADKRCGHLPGKQLVPKNEMVDRIKQCVLARENKDFVIMARTDAYQVEGLEKTIERAISYKSAGADMLFAEAFTDLKNYQKLKNAIEIPILANITEFGITPLYSKEELSNHEVDIVLYPLSANRAMNKAAFDILQEIRKQGSQKNVLVRMQTRDELYEILQYEVKS